VAQNFELSGQTGSGRGLKFRMMMSIAHPNLTLQFQLNWVKFFLISVFDIRFLRKIAHFLRQNDVAKGKINLIN